METVTDSSVPGFFPATAREAALADPPVTPDEVMERAREGTKYQNSLPTGEIMRRTWAVYYQKRAEIETEVNIGRLVSIDVQSGDYELDSDGVVGPTILRRRRPDAIMGMLRVGYATAFKKGGSMRRLSPMSVPEVPSNGR